MSHRSAAGVQHYWADQLELLRTLPAAVQAREEESIHDLRAAGRRTKSTLRTFRPLIRRPLATELIAELDWYNGMLGQARDAEVIRAGVDAVLVDRPGVRTVDAALLAEQQRTVQLAEHALAGPRTAALLELVEELVEAPWRGDRNGDPPGQSALLGRLEWAQRRLARAWRQGPRTGEEMPAWRHRVRRRAKSVRYACEALAEQLPELTDQAARFAEVSRLLGVVQDSRVINAALRQWPTQMVADAIAARDEMAAEALAAVPDVLEAALSGD